ncbi:MAG: sensor histidine kinase response regulator, and, putative heme-binding [Verrucomicrobiales bacterium]|nr:sensor histidine kinase response regulator, and, putative heme-binding [Verrucomicrobiales bacterium]
MKITSGTGFARKTDDFSTFYAAGWHCSGRMNTAGLSTISRIVILMAVYFLAGIVGNVSSLGNGSIDLVWPPFGIGLAAILLFGYRFWPGIFFGAVLFGLTSGQPLGYFMFGSAIGQTMGAIFGSYLSERFLQFRPDLSRVRDVAGLAGLACLLGTTVTAVFSAIALCLAGGRNLDNIGGTLVEWWIPNLMAGLIVTPLILAWGNRSRRRFKSIASIEAVLCAAGLIGGTMLSTNSGFAYGIQTYPLAYLPYPFLVWAALRFGQRGAATGTFIVSILAIHSFLHNCGPFVMRTERDGLILMGCYLGILAITTMLLAAAATEREDALSAVSESEKRYRAVVEDQSEMIWRFRQDGTVTFANEAYCRFHGKTRVELVGSKYLPLLSDDDREIPLSYFASMPPEDPSVSYEYRLSHSNGTVTWQECSTRRLFDREGKTLEFQSVSQDITRRKVTEEGARNAEERLRAILNTMVDGVLVAAANGMIVLFNPAAEQVFLRDAADLTGQCIKNLFSSNEEKLFDDAFAVQSTEGPTKIEEGQASRKDGSFIPVDLGISKVWVGGTPLWIVVVRDITERKRLEEQIRQAHKMEAVGRLAGGIAHDFNNLIQAILGYTNLLLTRPDFEAESRDTVEQIEKAADSAASLTGQLLAFSRKQVLQPKTFSLNNSVTEITRLVQRLIGANIELKTELSSNSTFVSADPGQVEQVILNLCVNARDAMPQGGGLSLKTSCAEIWLRLEGFSSDFRPGSYVVLSVADTGCGISAEIRSKLFEPFFTTKELGRGTGLGLSIVYGIIKQSGGEILIESELGKGTAFHIYLPQVEPPAIEAPAISAIPKSSHGGETVLLVEDGEIVRTLLTEVLASNGYNVLEACDGEEALRMAQEHNDTIDLLITDLVMPKISGRSLADRLHALRPEMLVLFISGYTDDEVVRHGKMDASAAFLQKPFRPDALITRVRSLLDGSIAVAHECVSESARPRVQRNESCKV